MQQYQLTFIDLALRCDALRFGHFTLKSGRESPYFFNAGMFSAGAATAALGRCYAAAIIASGLAFDTLFGPAYKGIPLAIATAIALGTVIYRPSVRVGLYAALGTAFTVVAQAALNVALTPFAIPALTAPFVLVTWIFMAPREGLETSRNTRRRQKGRSLP